MMNGFKRCSLLVVSLGLVAACDSNGTAVVMTAADDAPAYGAAPFPTDALREGDHLGVLRGLDTLVERHGDLVAAQLAALDGFGLRPLIEFPFTGALDETTAPVNTTQLRDIAGLVDIDPASPEHGRVIAMDWHYDDTRHVLAGAPASGEALREGTRYAAFLTNDIHDTSNAPIARASAFDDLQAPRWQSTRDALHELDAARSGIAAITVFTTQHATAPMIAAKAITEALPASQLSFDNPAIVFSDTAALDRLLGQATRAVDGARMGLERWGNDNPTGIAHEHVGVIGSGTMTIARFRRDDTKTDGPEDETFSDPPQIISMDTIPVTFVLPRSPMPTDGYPVVIYGHGLGASRDQLFSFAEPLTSQGYAVVGIDMAGHGSRFDPTDIRANMANQLSSFTGVAAMPDGFGDTTGLVTQFDFFEGFLGVSAVRDSIRQSALDLGRVVQMIRQPGLDLSALAGPGSANPRLDTRRIAYLGESFGTVVGTLFAATEPDVDLFVLDVPGGGILDRILPESAEIGSLAMPIIQSIYSPRYELDRWNPLLGLMQAVLDGGDPLAYAPHIVGDRFDIGGTPLGPRSIVCLEVMGDEIMSNASTEALARELGLDVLAPSLATPTGMHEIASPAAGNRENAQTAVLVQYSPATHGANWSSEHGVLRFIPGFPVAGDDPFQRLPSPVTIREPIYETHEQVAEILASHLAGGAPRVRMTIPPVADFDGDGVPDASDPAPYDPAH